MSRITTDVLMHYGLAIDYMDQGADEADTVDKPLVLVWTSPEVDSDGDPLHIVRVPCSPQARVILGHALLATQPPIPEAAAAESETTPNPDGDGEAKPDTSSSRCRKCGARDADGCPSIAAVPGWSDADMEAQAEAGCQLAIQHIDAGPA